MLLRNFVIATNSIWPLSKIYQALYSAAIACFTNACRSFPQVKSLYLRHGITQGDWVPGVSDIDFTLVIDADLEAKEEFVFLTKFWKKYLWVKMFFPMLGEVEIFNEEQIKIWTKHGIRGYESKGWKLLCGTPTLGNNYTGNLRADAFIYADRFYNEFFLYELSKSEPDGILLQRYAVKIFKYANYGQTGKWREKMVCSKEELKERLLKDLERASSSVGISIGARHPLDLAMTVMTHPRRRKTIMPPEGHDFPTCAFFERMVKETLSVIAFLEKQSVRKADIRKDRSNYDCYLLLRDLGKEMCEGLLVF